MYEAKAFRLIRTHERMPMAVQTELIENVLETADTRLFFRSPLATPP